MSGALGSTCALFGVAGTPLKAVFTSDGESITVRSEIDALARRPSGRSTPNCCANSSAASARRRSSLGAVDVQGLASGLFLPVSELNHLRQNAVDELTLRRNWASDARIAERSSHIEAAVAAVDVGTARANDEPAPECPRLTAQVYQIDDADRAAAAGATEICFDPFLRHPSPPLARVRALRDRLADAGVTLRLRTPTIVRPEERRSHSEVARSRPPAPQRASRARRRSWRAPAATSSPTTRSMSSTRTRRPRCFASARGASSRRSS